MKKMDFAGTGCLPQTGSSAVPGAVSPASGGWPLTISAAAGSRLHSAFGGRVVYRARFRSLINPSGIAMPVTHRMRTSASEP